MSTSRLLNGKEELIRLADMLIDIELPDDTDACFGMLAMIGARLLCSSRGDTAPWAHHLARMMETS